MHVIHHNPLAIGGVVFLGTFFEFLDAREDPFDTVAFKAYGHRFSTEIWQRLETFWDEGVHLPPLAFMEKHPNNIVALEPIFYALYCANSARSFDEVVGKVASFGGDVDSTLSLSLMMKTLMGGKAGLSLLQEKEPLGERANRVAKTARVALPPDGQLDPPTVATSDSSGVKRKIGR
jgi:hypothetical protein